MSATKTTTDGAASATGPPNSLNRVFDALRATAGEGNPVLRMRRRTEPARQVAGQRVAPARTALAPPPTNRVELVHMPNGRWRLRMVCGGQLAEASETCMRMVLGFDISGSMSMAEAAVSQEVAAGMGGMGYRTTQRNGTTYATRNALQAYAARQLIREVRTAQLAPGMVMLFFFNENVALEVDAADRDADEKVHKLYLHGGTRFAPVLRRIYGHLETLRPGTTALVYFLTDGQDAGSSQERNAYVSAVHTTLRTRCSRNSILVPMFIKAEERCTANRYDVANRAATVTAGLENLRMMMYPPDADRPVPLIDGDELGAEITSKIVQLAEEITVRARLPPAPGSETPGSETPGSETPGSETPGSEVRGFAVSNGEQLLCVFPDELTADQAEALRLQGTLEATMTRWGAVEPTVLRLTVVQGRSTTEPENEAAAQAEFFSFAASVISTEMREQLARGDINAALAALELLTAERRRLHLPTDHPRLAQLDRLRSALQARVREHVAARGQPKAGAGLLQSDDDAATFVALLRDVQWAATAAVGERRVTPRDVKKAEKAVTNTAAVMVRSNDATERAVAMAQQHMPAIACEQLCRPATLTANGTGLVLVDPAICLRQLDERHVCVMVNGVVVPRDRVDHVFVRDDGHSAMVVLTEPVPSGAEVHVAWEVNLEDAPEFECPVQLSARGLGGVGLVLFGPCTNIIGAVGADASQLRGAFCQTHVAVSLGGVFSHGALPEIGGRPLLSHDRAVLVLGLPQLRAYRSDPQDCVLRAQAQLLSVQLTTGVTSAGGNPYVMVAAVASLLLEAVDTRRDTNVRARALMAAFVMLPYAAQQLQHRRYVFNGVKLTFAAAVMRYAGQLLAVTASTADGADGVLPTAACAIVAELVRLLHTLDAQDVREGRVAAVEPSGIVASDALMPAGLCWPPCVAVDTARQALDALINRSGATMTLQQARAGLWAALDEAMAAQVAQLGARADTDPGRLLDALDRLLRGGKGDVSGVAANIVAGALPGEPVVVVYGETGPVADEAYKVLEAAAQAQPAMQYQLPGRLCWREICGVRAALEALLLGPDRARSTFTDASANGGWLPYAKATKALETADEAMAARRRGSILQAGDAVLTAMLLLGGTSLSTSSLRDYMTKHGAPVSVGDRLEITPELLGRFAKEGPQTRSARAEAVLRFAHKLVAELETRLSTLHPTTTVTVVAALRDLGVAEHVCIGLLARLVDERPAVLRRAELVASLFRYFSLAPAGDELALLLRVLDGSAAALGGAKALDCVPRALLQRPVVQQRLHAAGVAQAVVDAKLGAPGVSPPVLGSQRCNRCMVRVLDKAQRAVVCSVRLATGYLCAPRSLLAASQALQATVDATLQAPDARADILWTPLLAARQAVCVALVPSVAAAVAALERAEVTHAVVLEDTAGTWLAPPFCAQAIELAHRPGQRARGTLVLTAVREVRCGTDVAEDWVRDANSEWHAMHAQRMRDWRDETLHNPEQTKAAGAAAVPDNATIDDAGLAALERILYGRADDADRAVVGWDERDDERTGGEA